MDRCIDVLYTLGLIYGFLSTEAQYSISSEDTTRADAFRKVDTPNLDALGTSAKGQVIDMAIAPSSWTSPSVLSMFTGQSVREHGWDYPIAQEMIRNKMEYPAISKSSRTLAEVLARWL